MSGKIYHFKTTGGDTLIPVADDTFYTDHMDTVEYVIGNCFIEFYDTDGETPITPTGGTITWASTPFHSESQYLAPPSDGVTTATDVIAGDAVYTPPSFDATVARTRMTLASITGASYVRAYHSRYPA